MVITRRQSAAAAQAHEDQISPHPKPSTLSNMTPSTNTPDSMLHQRHQSKSTPDIISSQVDNDKSKNKPTKKSDLLVRALSGLALTFFFYIVIRGGHICVGIAVIIMEMGMFNEILRLGFTIAQQGRIPMWRTTGWYFFVTQQFLFYGKMALSHFDDKGTEFSKHPAFQYALRHHTFIAFCMYCAGFVGFVISLRQHMYHYQFTYLGRALVALILVSLPSHFMILNISQGLIWFILPCWLIIVNDSFGYFCGRLFGRHSLTPLSPKKTWEGYIGAGIFTMITAFFLSRALSNYPALVCPKYDFRDCNIFCPPVSCNPLPDTFTDQIATITLIPGITPSFSFIYKPVQVHAIALGFFAASIAPFGGFFASGAKRAFGIKDFGGILPGHGGITDRVDCQLMMGVFTYVYLINFIKVNFTGSPDVGKIMAFVSELSINEQVELLSEIYTRLERRGVSDLVTKLINGTFSN